MNADKARLTVYFGERTRSGGESLAEGVMTVFEGASLTTAVLLRGSEGFGPGHHLRTSAQLSLSEDLPMVAIALDSGERIRAVSQQVRPLIEEGLVTVEWVQASSSATSGNLAEPAGAWPPGAGASRVTVWTARHDRIEGVPAHVSLVDTFRQKGLSAAIALPGVDGLADGVRRRAGFFSANRSVPMLVIGVGQHEAVVSAGDTVSRLLPEAVVETLRHASPEPAPVGGSDGGGQWRLSVFGDGTRPCTGIPRQRQIVRMLRENGASGVTAYFGHYGFVGPVAPRGDTMRSLRRRIPVVTEVVDSPENCRRWIREIEAMDDCSLLITVSRVQVISPPAGPA